jgi:hypothetical protein
MTADCLKNLKALNERAGEWYAVAEKGTVDICTRKPRRPSVVALMLSPEDAECVIAEHEAVPDLCDEVVRLQEALSELLDLYYDRVPRGHDIRDTSSEELEKRMKFIGPHIFRVGPVLKARAALEVE